MNKRDIAFIVVVLVLMFLFLGEPDVFDAVVEVTRNWLLK